MESLRTKDTNGYPSQGEPTANRAVSMSYQDADIYQVLVADLIINHSHTLKQVPLETAQRAMQDAWQMSYRFER